MPSLQGRLFNQALGQVIDLAENSTIGRSVQSHIPVNDPRVSRRHALVRLQDDGFWFFDLGSSNGSYLNGKRVTTAQRLRDGDIIAIGAQKFVFECSRATEADSSLSITEQTIVEVQPRNAVLLVADIHGFTSLSERLDPAHLAPIIGTWYSEIEHVLDEHGATLDKFIGDCVLAYWLDTSIASRLSALRTAHVMQRVCDQVQQTHCEVLEEIGLNFRTGTAIHIGPTAHGAFTSGAFTLLGDAVNLTFRLEALTRDLDKRVLVSRDFLKSWDEGHTFCRPCGSHHVKGRKEPVEVFSLEHLPA